MKLQILTSKLVVALFGLTVLLGSFPPGGAF